MLWNIVFPVRTCFALPWEAAEMCFILSYFLQYMRKKVNDAYYEWLHKQCLFNQNASVDSPK